MKCDKCGQEMEFGYLNTLCVPIGGAVIGVSFHWLDCTKQYSEGLSHAYSPNVIIEAYRCQKCQLIVFSYAKQEKREFREEGVKHYDEVENTLDDKKILSVINI